MRLDSIALLSFIGTYEGKDGCARTLAGVELNWDK